MEIINTIKEITEQLNKLDEYSNALSERQSEIDIKQQDLLHYIENEKLNVKWVYKYVKELQDVRKERRKIKNDICLMAEFKKQQDRLLHDNTRQFLLKNLYQKEKEINRPYIYKQYQESEIKEVLCSNHKED